MSAERERDTARCVPIGGGSFACGVGSKGLSPAAQRELDNFTAFLMQRQKGERFDKRRVYTPSSSVVPDRTERET